MLRMIPMQCRACVSHRFAFSLIGHTHKHLDHTRSKYWHHRQCCAAAWLMCNTGVFSTARQITCAVLLLLHSVDPRHALEASECANGPGGKTSWPEVDAGLLGNGFQAVAAFARWEALPQQASREHKNACSSGAPRNTAEIVPKHHYPSTCLCCMRKQKI